MDDEAQYGPEFHRLTFGAAVERGLLSDYQVIAIAVDSSVIPGGDKTFSDTDLSHGDAAKFAGAGDDTPPELHANELVLLAYYLAAIKIEEGYASRNPGGRYQAFQSIVWCDTFRSSEEHANPRIKGMRRNSRRAQRQNDQEITVIVGNPPWSAGKKSSGDDANNGVPATGTACAGHLSQPHGRILLR